jgi:DNA-binding IclR family transcriptional regulator
MNFDPDPSTADALLSGPSPASQTLVRGLDVLEKVADGPVALSAIARALGLSRSTVHRLATTLLERRYLNVTPRRGYSLGPKLLELGFLARDQISLVRLARPYLEALAMQTGDVAMLAVRNDDDVLLADQAAGRRRVLPSLRTGDRLPLTGCALGEALSADTDDVVLDDGLSEIRTIAAPVRGADGRVRGALGIAAASVYADHAQQESAAAAVREAAGAMSAELGWRVLAASDPAPTAARQLRDTHVATVAPGRGAAGIEADILDERERDRMGRPKR